MGDGVEGEAAQGAGGGVAKMVGHVAVGGFMNTDGKNDAAEDDDESGGVCKE